MDLTEFVKAQLDEEEAAAEAATPGEWAALDGGVQSVEDDSQWPVAQTESARDREDRVHIARHDPARVLREVAAKRRILARHQMETESYLDGDGIERPGHLCQECDQQEWPCPTVRDEVSVWSDHPGYDPAWAAC